MAGESWPELGGIGEFLDKVLKSQEFEQVSENEQIKNQR
jgi:hypothetical protein